MALIEQAKQQLAMEVIASRLSHEAYLTNVGKFAGLVMAQGLLAQAARKDMEKDERL